MIIFSVLAAIRTMPANIKLHRILRALSRRRRNSEADVREGIITVALMQAMAEACTKGLPVKIKDVLARHDLADLLQA